MCVSLCAGVGNGLGENKATITKWRRRSTPLLLLITLSGFIEKMLSVSEFAPISTHLLKLK